MYRSSKTYGHEVGLSACFRQHRADSHCRFLHGYALAVHFEFEADELDHNHWVIDFGGLKSMKEWLVNNFDHHLIIASDDPRVEELSCLEDLGLAQIIVLDNVGCEAFAEHIGQYAERWLEGNGHTPRVRLSSVTVREHGANSASWCPEREGGQYDRV